MEEAEKKLSESKSKLALFQSRNKSQNQSNSSNSNMKSRSQPVIPAKASKTILLHPSSSSSGQSNSANAVSEKRKQAKQPKRNIGEQKWHDSYVLVPYICRSLYLWGVLHKVVFFNSSKGKLIPSKLNKQKVCKSCENIHCFTFVQYRTNSLISYVALYALDWNISLSFSKKQCSDCKFNHC